MAKKPSASNVPSVSKTTSVTESRPIGMGKMLALLIAPVVVAAIVAFVGASSLAPAYGARSDVVFHLQQSGDVTERYLATQAVIVRSQTILGPVSHAVGIPIEKLERELSVEFPKGSAVMRLEYADHDGTVALKVVQAIVDRYLAVLSETEGVDKTSHQLLAPPFLLEEPVRPKPMQAAAVAAALGLALSIAAFAFIQQRRGK
jgi:capsular polysaccharide biosynthesis protein